MRCPTHAIFPRPISGDSLIIGPPNGSLLEQLQASLGPVYALERELGSGGMSHVFVATETALRRQVVVKVLSPLLAESISAERFTREIALAAQLQDPHIVPVLHAGVAGQLPWFTMPYVSGESLRARLLRGAVPYGEALGILRDVALALEYAHAHGVVHRDIKPENVLLAGRTAVVADFGIAKALSASRTLDDSAQSATLTSEGQSLGTPAYMAPEQASGDPTDHRADLYAWGVVAWELLAGRHPFTNKSSTQALIAAHIAEKPADLMKANPEIAPPLAAFVMRCLEKTPANRPANAGAIIETLDGLVTPGGQVTAPTAADSSVASVSASVDTGRIAVLPFENLGDSADEYFADGMTDAVRGKLTSLAGLVVIARASSVPYARTSKTPRQIADELGVRYLLTGTVRFAKTPGSARVQVSPALVEVGSDGTAWNRWQQPFDADMADVFKVQGQIAEQVVGAMQLVLDRSSQTHLAVAPTSMPDAYDAYLRGEAAWGAGSRQDVSSLVDASESYARAVELDPGFAAAWGALARSRADYVYNNHRTNVALRRAAAAAAQRAFELDSNGVDGLLAMVAYERLLGNNLERAAALLERASRIAPNAAGVVFELAEVRGELGRFDEGLRGYDLASRLDPRNVRPLIAKTRLALRIGDVAVARRASDRALALDPSNVQAIGYRVMTQLVAGDLNSARAVVAAAAQRLPIERIAVWLGQFHELGWVLTPDQDKVLHDADVDAFGGSHSTRAMVKAQQYFWRGDKTLARIHADSAAELFAVEIAQNPSEVQAHMFRALSLAIAGHASDAITVAKQAMTLQNAIPGARLTLQSSYYLYVGAQVAAAASDPDQAYAWLAEARRRRYVVSPAWARLDPSFRAFKGDPKFEEALSVR